MDFFQNVFENVFDPVVNLGSSVGSNIPFIGSTIKATGSTLTNRRKTLLEDAKKLSQQKSSKQSETILGTMKDGTTVYTGTIPTSMQDPIIDKSLPPPRTKQTPTPTKVYDDLSPVPTPPQSLTSTPQLITENGVSPPSSYGGALNNVNTNSNLKNPTNGLPDNKNNTIDYNQYLYPALFAGGLFILYETRKK